MGSAMGAIGAQLKAANEQASSSFTGLGIFLCPTSGNKRVWGAVSEGLAGVDKRVDTAVGHQFAWT